MGTSQKIIDSTALDKKVPTDHYYWIPAGQAFYFSYEGNTGDLVIYPSRRDPKLQTEPLEEAEA